MTGGLLAGSQTGLTHPFEATSTPVGIHDSSFLDEIGRTSSECLRICIHCGHKVSRLELFIPFSFNHLRFFLLSLENKVNEVTLLSQNPVNLEPSQTSFSRTLPNFVPMYALQLLSWGQSCPHKKLHNTPKPNIRG